MDLAETPLILDQDNHEMDIVITAVLPNGEKHPYNFDSNSTVGDLMKLIKEDSTIEKPADRLLCIMYRGKLLQPAQKFSQIDSVPSYSVIVMFRLNHTESSNDSSNNTTELRGFDRLTRMNYSEEQIQDIRHHFHEMRGGQNESEDQKYEAEEEWLPVIFNCENPLDAFEALDTERPARRRDPVPTHDQIEDISPSTLSTFLFAFVIGIIFGPVSLLCFIVSFQDLPGCTGIITGALIHFIIFALNGFSYF